MHILIVVESYYGNTRQIAHDIAIALSSLGHGVELVSASEAPTQISPEIDLVIIGAPTHNRGLPRSSSRPQTGAADTSRGMRDWLASLTILNPLHIALFTTVTSRSWFAGSAAKEAHKLLARRYGRGEMPMEHFIVDGPKGPLHSGESERAAEWAASLV